MGWGDQDRCIRAFRTLWIVQSILFLVTASAFFRIGFQFEHRQTIIGFVQLVALTILSMLLLKTKSGWKIGAAFTALTQYILFLLIIVMFSHSVATLNFAYFDAPLLNFDRSIGYDWHAYASYVAERPALANLMRAAYRTILWQPIFVIMALAATNRCTELVTYLVATFLTLIVTISIFAFFPVTTAWVFTHTASDIVMKKLSLAGADHGWVHQLLELRAGHARLVPWSVASGVVGFPSFHAAAALLNCFALRRVKNVRYWAFILNGIMISATPLFGGHYLADVLAGLTLAAVSIHLAAKLFPLLTERWPARNIPSPPPNSQFLVNTSTSSGT